MSARAPIVLVIQAQIARPEVPAICERLRRTVAGSDAEEVVCDVGALDDPDLGVVELLARLQLSARRLGRRVRLRHASSALTDLLALAGLADLLRVEAWGQTEEREKRLGVEEERHLGDPSV